MATETTNFNNVITEEGNNEKEKTNTKNPVEYGMDFTGNEVLKWQPHVFDAFGKTTRIRSDILAKEICTMFKQTFHELKGCNIVPLPNGQFSVELYFERNTEPLPAGKIMNLESLIDGTGANNLYYRQQVIQNRKAGKAYTLNNETKLLLSKFMFGGKEANKPNNTKIWNSDSVIKEVHIPVNSPFFRSQNTDRILVRASGLDIRRILQELYGRDMVTKTIAGEEGDINYRGNAQYEPRFIKANADGTFIMNIEQFDKAAVESIFMQENPIPQQYLGVQMYS